VAVWDAATGGSWLLDDPHATGAIAFGRMGSRVVLVEGWRVWDPVAGTVLSHLRTEDERFRQAPFRGCAIGAVGGRTLGAVASAYWVGIWDVATASPLRAVAGTGAGSGVAIAAGRLVSAAGREVRVWDPLSGELVVALVHADVVRCLAVVEVPGRALLVTGCDDGSVQLWDLVDGRRLTMLGLFAVGVHAVAATSIDTDLLVYAQARTGRVVAWRVPL
jgi:WD40 repeat protein